MAVFFSLFSWASAQVASDSLMLFDAVVDDSVSSAQVDSSFSVQADSSVSVQTDSLISAQADSAVSAQMDSATTPVQSSAPDTVAPASATLADTSHPLKTVLYLSGGERSPWFHLGVLYAIEEYGIPVDSIVGTSWGAWIGALWAKGVSLDEIQRLMQDAAIAPYVGHDLSDGENTLGKSIVDPLEWPVSIKGIPSIRQRFTLRVDSSARLTRQKKSLYADSMEVKRSLAKIRFEEILYRQKTGFPIPFSVQGCNGANEGNEVSTVIASLPLWTSDVNGELCPHYATPVEDSPEEFPIIIMADPLRSSFSGDAKSKLLKNLASENLNNLPGSTIRAHSALDTSRAAMIQLGFSTVERYLGDFSVLNGRHIAYDSLFKDRTPRKAWFRFNPVFDSLSAETHRTVNAYWNSSDTGLVALENFAHELLERPTYDSLTFDMQPTGDLMVSAAVHPTFDVAVGGFGSNALGANAYFEGGINFVSQMEIELVLSGFWGMSSYGVQPRLNVSKLWSKHWGLGFGYDYLMLRPLKTFNSETSAVTRIESEERSDFTMSLVYNIDDFQKVSAEFLFGNRVFELDSLYYGNTAVKTYPVSPMLHYQYLRGDEDPWFAQKGFDANLSVGLQSIGFDFGVNDLIPIYWKILGDVRYTVSPKPFTTFTVGVAGGMQRYHKEGYGYVSPKSFDYAPLDIVYRMHPTVTPWLTEWYNTELASHEYGLVRGSASLHSRYAGLWLFAAAFHDFEGNPYAKLARTKFVLEPAIRLNYRSLDIYVGLDRIVDADSFGDLKKFKDYTYFIRIGNYQF